MTPQPVRFHRHGEISGSYGASVKITSEILSCVFWYKLSDAAEVFTASIIRAIAMYFGKRHYWDKIPQNKTFNGISFK
jgi:hypothetical protein